MIIIIIIIIIIIKQLSQYVRYMEKSSHPIFLIL